MTSSFKASTSACVRSLIAMSRAIEIPGSGNESRGTAVADPDGRIRIVLAHAKPPASAGIQNWLDPKGHREGTMVFRWSRPVDPMPEIQCELVPWTSL